MKSFIEKIDSHIREDGIPFKQIVIPSSYLPTYINYAILQKINEKVEYKDMFWPEEYALEYDEKDRLFLRAVSYNERTNTLIYSNNDYHFNCARKNKNALSDVDLYDFALILKHYETIRKRVYNDIDKKYGKILSPSQKNKIRYDAMHDFYIEKYNELGNGIRTICSLEDELDKSIELITSYIDYLNDAYQKDQLKYRTDKTVLISYDKKTSEIERKKQKNSFIEEKTRKNKVISMDERTKVLEGYGYEYFGIAKPIKNNKVEYYCYLYKDIENKYMIVMEPYSGTKYTKIIRVPSNKEISKQEFADICKTYLELPFKDSLELPNITRLGHTSIDSFKINFRVFLRNVNENIINPNIRNLSK